MTVYKYEISFVDEFLIEMRRYAKLLHVDVQHGVPYVWAFVVPTEPMMKRRFRLAGTGHPLEIIGAHVGTFLTAGGDLVWHLFDYGEEGQA